MRIHKRVVDIIGANQKLSSIDESFFAIGCRYRCENDVIVLRMKIYSRKKREMVQFYSENGTVHPATIVDAGPITNPNQTKDVDGYDAVQVGFSSKKES